LIRKEREALRYAKAFFERVKEKDIEEKAREMALMVEIISKKPEILKFFSNPAIPLEDKKNIFKKILEGENELLWFIFLLLEKRNLKLLPIILMYFNNLMDKERKRIRVILTSACSVNEGLKNRLIERLKGILKKDVILDVVIDKNIIGGGILQIGSKRIDGSILGYLKRLEAMIGNGRNKGK